MHKARRQLTGILLIAVLVSLASTSVSAAASHSHILYGTATSPGGKAVQDSSPQNLATATISVDREEVAANSTATIYLNWNIWGAARIDEHVYSGTDYSASGTIIQVNSPMLSNQPASAYNFTRSVSVTSADPVRTYVYRIFDQGSNNIAQAHIVVRYTTKPVDNEYVSAYSNFLAYDAPGGPGWCLDDAAWLTNTQQGRAATAAEFNNVYNALKASTPNNAKSPAVAVAVIAFRYRNDESDPNGVRNFSCIGKKIKHVLDTAEYTGIPVELHISFINHFVEERPDLWNFWYDGTGNPNWLSTYQTNSGDNDYLTYVAGKRNPQNYINVEWTGTGTSSDASSKAMKDRYLGWAENGFGTGYGAPTLNIASATIQQAVWDIITNQVKPALTNRLAVWHQQDRDWLLAGLTGGVEDGFVSQMCGSAGQALCLYSGTNPPPAGRVYLPGFDKVRTYGNMAWMSLGCPAGTAPCSNPVGDKINTLRNMLYAYEKSLYQRLNFEVGIPREKLYTHSNCVENDQYTGATSDFTTAAFNEFAQFGASFYRTSGVFVCPSLSSYLNTNNHDSWMIAEAGADDVQNEMLPILQNTSYNLPNNRLSVIAGYEGLIGAAQSAVRSYMGSTTRILQGKYYGGAISVVPLAVPGFDDQTTSAPNSPLTVNLNWWVSSNTPANGGGVYALVKVWADYYSDGTLDQEYNFATTTQTSQQSLSLNVGMSTYECSRTYWFELLGGFNYSYRIARQKFVVYNSNCTPYNSSVALLPAKIQAEDFDNGGEGLSYHDTDATNNGGAYRTNVGVDLYSCSGCGNNTTVGVTYAGEWLAYQVRSSQPATYSVAFATSSAGGGGIFHLEDEHGINLTGSMTVPNTGDWNHYLGVTSSSSFRLGSGLHRLKLVMDSNGATGFVGNFDSFSVTLDPNQ